MEIKWNKSAIKQLMAAIKFIEENGFFNYAEELERDIISRIRNIPQNPLLYSLDKYRRNNNGTYRSFEVDHYRISYRHTKNEIRIVRVRHTSRRPRKY